MAQIQRSTSAPTNASTITTITTTLRSEMAQGLPIKGSSFVSLISALNTGAAHRHSYLDLYGVKSFGDTNPPNYSPAGNYVTGKLTSVSGNGGLNPTGLALSTGDPVPATIISAIINAANQYRNTHFHVVDDRTQ